MPPENHADIMKLMETLMPYAQKRRAELIVDPRLAYYTQATTAEKLIRNQELWFRDCTEMNDYREVKHGVEILEKHFADPAKRAAFCAPFDAVHPGVSDEILRMFEEWKKNRCAETYLMSLSVHAPKDLPPEVDEDQYGRLSMWRDYGGPEGVSIVFRIPMGAGVEGFNLFFSPVGYFNEVESHIAGIVTALTAQKELLAGVAREHVRNGAFTMLVMAATSMKHPGFYEEREWRILYLPSTWSSKVVTAHTETIDGKAQTVFKITFPAMTKGGMPGMDLDTLIDRVIVGPTERPDAIKGRMVKALEDMSVKGADKRVIPSGIPYRFRSSR